MYYNEHSAPPSRGAHPRRLLRRGHPAGLYRCGGQLHRDRARRHLHAQLLRHDRLGDTDHDVSRAHHRAGPAKNYYTLWRTIPDSCDWSWPEMEPVGVTRTYVGQEVYEGAHTYRGLHVVPGWGGSMFEELMPNVFVPEQRWRRAAGDATTRFTYGPNASTALTTPATGTGDSRPRATRPVAIANTVSTPSGSTPTATSPTRRAPTTTPGTATAARPPTRTPPTVTAW